MRLVRAWCAFWPARLRRAEAGAANVEYALLTAFIAVGCIAAVGFFGVSLKDYIIEAAGKL